LVTIGAIYLAAVCLLPEILRGQLAIPFYFGGTSVLIVVSVTMDTITTGAIRICWRTNMKGCWSGRNCAARGASAPPMASPKRPRADK
jgi:hypothetical protein